MNVKDKVVMITGAGGGLGSEMARLLCKNGAKVVILDLDAEKGQATADEIVAAGQPGWWCQKQPRTSIARPRARRTTSGRPGRSPQ